MKTDKQKLIDYMKARESEVYRISNKRGLHFKKADEKIIKLWEDNHCKRVWLKIIKCIEQGIADFSGVLCPFCLFYYSCEECEYRNNHNGMCGYNTSDFKKYSLEIRLNHKWYRNLIKKIEKN